MTQLEILKYAYNGLLAIWEREYDRYREAPNNPIIKFRFEKYDAKLDELHDLLLQEEQKAEEEGIDW